MCNVCVYIYMASIGAMVNKQTSKQETKQTVNRKRQYLRNSETEKEITTQA